MKTKITLFILVFLLFISKGSAQTVTAVAAPSTCAANGKIELTATGIPGPIIYGIAKSPYTVADVISSTSPVFSFLEPGNYYYGYYNGADFIPSANTVSVANQYNTSSPTFSSYYSNPYTYCTGSVDPLGRINATVTGGNKIYTVQLLNSGNTIVQEKQTTAISSTVIFDGVLSGGYKLKAIDACGTVVYAPNTIVVQPNVLYTNFTLGAVNPQPYATNFKVVYNTPDNICSGIASAVINDVATVLSANITDITTPTNGPTFYGGRNPVYKLEIQNASGGFDVYDNLTMAQISVNNSYLLPNDRSKWGLVKLSVTICDITKTNQIDLAQYNEFKVKPFTSVSFSIYDDPSPAACLAANQVEVWTSTYQSGGCPPITLDVTENGTSNTQHYEIPQNFKFKLDIGKTYTILVKDGNGAVLPSYSFRNYTTSATTKPIQTDPNNLYIDPAYFMPKSIRDKIAFTDGLSGKNIGKSALVISNLTTALGLTAPVYIESVSGPSTINLTVTPTASSYNIGIGNNLTPGTYKIRIRDSQCFSEEYDIVLASYIVSLELQNVTSEPSTTTCDRYVKKGEINITAVGKQFDVSGPLYSIYGYDYAYPRILSGPGAASVFTSTDNFLLRGNMVIPFSFTADLPGNYQLALSRKNDNRLLQASEIFENTTTVPLTVQPNFPTFDLTQSGGVICPGNTTGNLTVKVNNAVGSVTYFIKKESDADFPSTGQTSTVFTGLTADTYVIKAKTLCYEVVQSFKLADLAQLTDIIFGDNTYCTGASLHFSTVAVGPVSSIVWTLPDNSTVSSNTLDIQNLTAANSGEYKVTINSIAGCVINGSTIVTVNPLAEVGVPVFNVLSPSLLCQSVTPQKSDYTAEAANATSISYNISPPEAGTLGADGQPGKVEWNPSFYGTAVITAVSSGCGTDESTNFTVTMSPRADTSKIIAEGRTICPNENNIVLEAFAPSINNAVFTWYDSNLDSALILGTAYRLTVSPSTTTTYYVGVQGDDICINEAGNRKAVAITVNPVAVVSDINTADQTICSGETVTLTASSPLINPQFVWYTDPNLENSISNTETASVSPTVTTTYYVTVSADGICTIPPPAKPVVVTVNQLPIAAISYSAVAYCNRGTAVVTQTGVTGGTYTGDAGLVINISTGEINLASSTIGSHIVTYNFTDGICPNTATAVIIINATTLPAALADITAECSVSPTAPVLTDPCSGILTASTTTQFPITTQGTTAIIWTFDYGAGYTQTINQNVIIDDVTAPIVPVLADVIAQCEVNSIIVPTTTDNCAGTITGTTNTVFPITTQGTTNVTWEFDDGNGNISTAVQKVIITDTTAPAVPVLADVIAQCEVISITAPTTTDNCAGTVTGTTTTQFPITTQGTKNITWTFDDGNGNTSTAVQKVIIDDVTAPAVPVLKDVIAQCEVNSIIVPTTTDNCAGTITGTTNTVFPITTQGTTNVTWTFDDGNGNTSTAVQKVIIDDVTAPAVPVLTDVIAQCEVISIMAPTTTDNCAGTVTGTTTTQFPITTQGTTNVTWTFDDGNGNTSTAIQKVIIKDTTPPVIPVLNPYTAECSISAIIPPATTDNCAGIVVGTTTTQFPITTQGETNINWIFDDGNGNTSTAIQKFVIEDLTPPEAPNLADITGQCSVTPQIPVAVDNCAGIVTGTTTTQFPITALGTTVVLWTFDDKNGNISTTSQNVIISGVELTAPEKAICLTNKPEYTVTLTVTGEAPYTASGTGAPGTWSGNNWTSDIISSGTDYSINFQDKYACNTLTVVGESPNCCVFTVQCPTFASVTVSCYDDLPSAVNLTKAQFEALGNGDGKITNNCGVIEILASNSPDMGCDSNITRTYTITEYEDTNQNGIHDTDENTIINSSVCTEIIKVHDTTPPVFVETLPQSSMNTDCSAIPEAVFLTAADNCSNAVVNFTETKVDGDCSSRYSVVRTWTATDVCGNQNTFTQTINVSCLPNIYNALSPNGDGINDFFEIEGIDCFPNNTVEIYNRYGVKVYKKEGYDNVTNPFVGFSDAKATVQRGDKLPTGTYFYTLEYDDNGKRIQKSGYLYINNQ